MKHRVLAVSVALALALVTAGAFASQRHGGSQEDPPAAVGAATNQGAPPASGAPARERNVRINHVVIDLGMSTPVPGAIGAPRASDSGRTHGRVPSVVPASTFAAGTGSSHDDDGDGEEDAGGHKSRGHDDDCDDERDDEHEDDDSDDCGGTGGLPGTPTAVMPTKTATVPAGGGTPPTATPTAPPPSPTSVAATPTATPTVRTCGSTPPPPEPCP